MQTVSLPVAVMGLDHLFHSTHCLLIGSINNPSVVQHTLKPNHIEFYYMKRPFMKVEVCGIITNKRLAKGKGIVVVDDGTGVIECVQYHKDGEREEISSLSVGDLVMIRGILRLKHSEFLPSMPFHAIDQMPQHLAIDITHLEVIEDENYELFHWNQCMELHRDVYSKPAAAEHRKH